VKDKLIEKLEKAVYVIDEKTLEEIFNTCYKLEHVNYY
jgi:lysine/ornithine N-monooxygenase